jgi:undecaprenyl-diphosphatase
VPIFERERYDVNLTEAIILGVIQGLTEFLPISSSAHLRIVPALVGWDDPGAAFTAVIQIGTLAAVLAYFRADIVRIARAWFASLAGGGGKHAVDARMGWMMIVATVPIVVCGMLFKDTIETKLRSLYIVAGALIGLAVLLAAAEQYVRRRAAAGIAATPLAEVTWRDAIVTGLAQALALVPGSSRSGVTITAGLFLGLNRETAARFSFLLSLPSVLAAGVYQLYKARESLLATSDDVLALLVATIVSAVVGYLSIAFLLRYLKTHTTYVFIAYRLLLGGAVLYWLASGELAG